MLNMIQNLKFQLDGNNIVNFWRAEILKSHARVWMQMSCDYTESKPLNNHCEKRQVPWGRGFLCLILYSQNLCLNMEIHKYVLKEIYKGRKMCSLMVKQINMIKFISLGFCREILWSAKLKLNDKNEKFLVHLSLLWVWKK